ncbi:hypothetical protein FJR41_021060, partial [Dolichospermum planctonicum UHCC 0167]|uniref:hypothetical protein n=1 Tax=Dolichospermum planctonicum TaxID=136072 RepID=UPI0020C4F4A7
PTMRIYLYILAGMTSALLGWNIGQFFLTDLGLFTQFPEITLFPCIAVSLAFGMVMNEIFVSNPTRPKRSFQTAQKPLLIALGLGILSGLIAGIISQILFLPIISVPTPIVRTLGWLLIGSSVGIAEGLSWRWYSMEAGSKKRFQQRLKTSVIAASGASLAAAIIFEIIRVMLGTMPAQFKGVEDPIGFSILGLLLGGVFSLTNSPSYLAALRAGRGFEYREIKPDIKLNIQPDTKNHDQDSELPTLNQSYPYINKSVLSFVTPHDSLNEDEIEEGLSISLPGNQTITIGSSIDSTISIPGLPPHLADIQLENRTALLIPDKQFFYAIEINSVRTKSRKMIPLKHNYVLTFYTIEGDEINEEKYYRFVYYNRFLDPQA